ncbi:hypothetical protein [Frondihabitans sp. PAMC 28766]|uniref:hypothetical protein n=1 Tax=Frondihabitans sp. PAMC 28766 TaxID=1795630 RepID=UPI0012FF9C9E|nr:hypothetical protein [Frondihabitans sp. PAMC 28766]
MIITGVALSASQRTSPVSPQLQRVQLLRDISATLDMTDGSWKFSGDATPWAVEVAERQSAELCVDGVSFTSEGSERYEVALLGPTVGSLESAIDAVRDAWRERGYEVRDAIPLSSGYPEIVAQTPEGITLAYSANSSGTSLSGRTQCFIASDE